MKNSKYWDYISEQYLSVWSKYEHRKMLNEMESKLIDTYLKQYKKDKKINKTTYLDIGCGPGRIIKIIINADPDYAKITGLDNSNSMINLCKNKFKNYNKINYVNSNIINYKTKFKNDVITCIRVLKYLPERKAVINLVSNILKKDGIFIFSVTNKNSIARMDFLKVKSYSDSKSEVTNILKREGFNILTVTGFQKIPEFLYILFSLIKLSKILFKIEKILNNLLGEPFLARTLYFVVKKNNEK